MQNYLAAKSNRKTIRKAVNIAAWYLQKVEASLLLTDAVCMDRMVLANEDVAAQVRAAFDGNTSGGYLHLRLKRFLLLCCVN